MNTKKSTDELQFGAFRREDAQVDVNKRKIPQRISLTGDSGRAYNSCVKKILTTDEVLELMKKQMGARTQSAYAQELGITKQYLSDIFQRRRDPGPKVLSRLGITQKLTYERTA